MKKSPYSNLVRRICVRGGSVWVGAALSMGIAGCNSDGSPSDGAGSGAAGGQGGASSESCSEAEIEAVRLEAKATFNYRFESTIELDVLRVAPQKILEYQWGNLSKNFLGQELTTGGIKGVHLVVWSYSTDEFSQALNEDNLPQHKILGLPLSFETQGERTSATTDEFGLLGFPIDEGTFEDEVMPWFDPERYPPERTTFTIMAAKSPSPGHETQMIQAFVLDETSEAEVVPIEDSSMKLKWRAYLSGMRSAHVPAGRAGVTLDWSELRTNAMGREFVSTKITHLLIGAYSRSLKDLEDDFINLESAADELYRLNVPEGSVADLSKAKSTSGEFFRGIDNERTWLVGLVCDDCYNPAPWYLSLLEPCP